MDQYLELYIILPVRNVVCVSSVGLVAMLTASYCVTDWTWNGLHKMQLCLTQFCFKLQDSSLRRLCTPSTPLLTCFFFFFSPSSLSFTSWPPLLLYLPPASSPSSSRSSSLFSSLSTGWAGQLPEYNLKLWDLSLCCRITTHYLQLDFSNELTVYCKTTADSVHPTRGNYNIWGNYFICCRNYSLWHYCHYTQDYNSPPEVQPIRTQPETQEPGTSGWTRTRSQTSTGPVSQSDSVEWIRPVQDRPEETSRNQ